MAAPDPGEAIKFRMDPSGVSVKDLAPIIGKSNRVYEVLNRKRPLMGAAARGYGFGCLAKNSQMTSVAEMRFERLPTMNSGSRLLPPAQV
jgi:hypothetical protein